MSPAVMQQSQLGTIDLLPAFIISAERNSQLPFCKRIDNAKRRHKLRKFCAELRLVHRRIYRKGFNAVKPDNIGPLYQLFNCPPLILGN